MKKLFFTITFMTVAMFSYGQEHGNTTTSTDTESYGADAGTAGTQNSYFGNLVGENDTGSSNSFFGWAAGQDNEGSFNVFLGQAAGLINKGDKNTFIGYGSGRFNNTGIYNTFLGTDSGHKNTSGQWNTFIGYSAGHYNLTGSQNVSLGLFASQKNTTGSNNTIIGVFAGKDNLVGSGNVFLGHSAGRYEQGDDKLYIDNTNTSDPLIYGDFSDDFVSFNGNVGIGTTLFVDGADTYALSVDGKIRANAVKVYTGWADFVFEEDYILPTLKDVEIYIKEHGHLKDIPSAKEVATSGIELGEMNKLLLQKIEELTLYTIELKKEVDELRTKKQHYDK